MTREDAREEAREEAREYLIDISYEFGFVGVEDFTQGKEGKKMREAIEILSQEPCEDCVSRADVETFLDKYNFVSYDYTVEDLVKALPSVTPKIETGHWSRKTKVDAYDLAGVKTWGIKCQCDRCTFTTTVVEDFGYYTYCPNCGAKMEREE